MENNANILKNPESGVLQSTAEDMLGIKKTHAKKNIFYMLLRRKGDPQDGYLWVYRSVLRISTVEILIFLQKKEIAVCLQDLEDWYFQPLLNSAALAMPFSIIQNKQRSRI